MVAKCEGIEFDYGTEVTSRRTRPPVPISADGPGLLGIGFHLHRHPDQARSVEATFTLQKRTPTVETSGTGVGTVGTDPPAPDFDFGTTVTLEAVPANGSDFHRVGRGLFRNRADLARSIRQTPGQSRPGSLPTRCRTPHR